MATSYNGQPKNITPPSALTITNVTNANPAVVTVSGVLPSTWTTGVRVSINGVLGAVGANGVFDISVTGASTFSVPQAAGGAYVSGGTAQLLALESITVPSDGDAEMAASVATPLDALQDEVTFLTAATGGYKVVWAGAVTGNDDTGGTYVNNNTGAYQTLNHWFPVIGNLTLPCGLLPGDVLQIKATFSVGSQPSSAVRWGFLLNTGLPTGGNYDAWKVPGSAVTTPTGYAGSVALSAVYTIPAGFSSPTTGGTQNRISVGSYAPGSESAFTLIGDYTISATVLRPTSVPQ